ncbi:MAG: lipoyl(octanoyl) transferase LipB [Planctomycetes bacterium]|nr:lipoyl(octanoyl) transferase LipB [Planctomycetota bacterium]
MVRGSGGGRGRTLTVHRPGRISWREGWEFQRRLAARAAEDRDSAHLLLVEHPPVFTLGRNARPDSLLVAEEEVRRRGIEVERCDRGGDVTWHGPGQVVGYPIVHLPTFRLGVGAFVHGLEDAMVRACAAFGVEAVAGRNPVGTWVRNKKIGSIGIHVSRGVSTHGFAFNASPDLSHFALIHPCGMPGTAMTTLAAETRRDVSWDEAADAMEREVFSLLGNPARPSPAIMPP